MKIRMQVVAMIARMRVKKIPKTKMRISAGAIYYSPSIKIEMQAKDPKMAYTTV